MKRKTRVPIVASASLLVVACATTLSAQPTGQWDFNNGNLSATVGGPLQYIDGPGGLTEQGTRFGSTTSLGVPDIGGAPAQVMRFPANVNVGMGYVIPNPPVGNGGGNFVNEWTIIFDLLFPAESDAKWRALMETDGRQINPDADFFVNPGNGVGIGGAYFGNVRSNTWYRIGIVVQASANKLFFYIDGVQVGFRDAGGAGALDGRWALSPSGFAELFSDDDGEAAAGYVNSIQLRDVALSKAQMAALGGAQAAGLPTALPAIPSFVERWIPAGAFANRDTAIGAVIDPGSTTIQDSSISLQLDGQAVATPSISRADGLITVRKDNPGLFVPGTTHSVVLTLTDSLAGQKSFTNTFEAALFFEDFESLTLGPPIDEAGFPNPDDNLNVWTNRPPPGWTVDNSQFPATQGPDNDGDGFADDDGRTEWAGWSFAKRDFWLTADDQRRSEFSLASGTLAIADPDEWDDQSHAQSLYNSFLITPPISLSGVGASSAFLRFASSWRPECCDDGPPGFPEGNINNQTAIITVKYDNGAPVEVFKWDSRGGSPTFHPDAPNESVLVPLNNPAGAQNMILTFALVEAANDWWWAIDNIVVSAGAAPPAITDQPDPTTVVEGQPVTLSVTATGSPFYQWLKGHGTGRTPIPGATSATYSLAAAKIEDNGFYSVVVSNSVGTAASITVKLTVTPVTAGRLVLLNEDFNGLPLGPNVDETTAGAEVWTKTPPAGWSIDDTGVPGVGDPDQDGVTEWAGWSFANKDWWAEVGGQNRSAFTKGTGTAAIADSDEWDDIGHAAGNMATYLKTKSISLAGVKPNSVILKFDSSWNPENPQKANITVTFDNGAPVEILRYESVESSPSFYPAELDDTIALRINNPPGAQNLVITFGYFDTRNNWWYAIDNLLVLGDVAPLFFEDFNSLALGPNVEEGITTGSGGPRTNVWTKTPPAGWTIDDTGVPGAGTANDGVTEWAGWSFADRAWWSATAGDQQRTQFTKGTGAVAIADGDEWDDLARAAGLMNTFLSTRPITISGQSANTLVLTFDSSWRDEPIQKANVRVSYDGGTPIEILRWESDPAGPNFHNDNVNETVTVPLNNPAGANSMTITFGYFDAGNNWWWAIDNIEVSVAAAPSNLGRLNAARSGVNINLSWTGGAGIRLQKTSTLSPPNWADVAGTLGNSSAAESAGAGAAYYRLFRP